MPNSIAIEMGMTLNDASNFLQERPGIGHRLLERTAALFLHRAHPHIIDRDPSSV
jgi:hypothetical protein